MLWLLRSLPFARASFGEFQAVQELKNKSQTVSQEKPKILYSVNIFKGKIYCAHCGGSLERKKNYDKYIYHCIANRYAPGSCVGSCIGENEVRFAVLKQLLHHKNRIGDEITITIVTKLKQFADQYNICVLLVHHTRKQNADDCFETISGTNGLFGAADGAFIMQKEKRTDNKAVLDIVGRDQQDQRLHLLFDRDRCVWQLTKTETELWKEPPDPLLEAVAKLLSPDSPAWSGSASELIDGLDRIDRTEMQPNVLMRRLNVGADRLWNEYGIRLGSARSHDGRIVKLTLDNPKVCRL